jgi:hypothetical protein
MNIIDLKLMQTRVKKKTLYYFINEDTKYCYTYLLISKDEAFEIFKHCKNKVKNQLNNKINVIRSDNGGEYKAFFS